MKKSLNNGLNPLVTSPPCNSVINNIVLIHRPYVVFMPSPCSHSRSEKIWTRDTVSAHNCPINIEATMTHDDLGCAF